jgi:hypothetical protein
MHSVSENGILSKREFEAFKNHTVESKFRYQLFLGVGGATVFGLVGAFGKALLEVATLSGPAAASLGSFAGLAATSWAWVGLAAIAAVGLGCIYMGSKFLAESILMDQDFQAKKIALAAGNSRGVAIESPEPTKVTSTPPGMAVSREQQQDTDTKWTEKFAQNAPVERWAEEVRKDEQAEQQTARTLH